MTAPAVRAVSTPSDADLARWNDELRDASAQELTAWAAKQFGSGLVLSSSFGAHAAVMLHLAVQAVPQIPVIFVDTGYLFPETYRFADKLEKDLKLNLKVFSATMTTARQEALYGKLWDKGDAGVAQYLRLNKVEPMRRALHELGATSWLAGLRADQTEHRGQLRRIDVQDGRVKVHPILNWSADEQEAYLAANKLPHHPLFHDGYRSIGDTHSTLPTVEGQDPREGRILGKKRECGIHIPFSDSENDSLKSSGL